MSGVLGDLTIEGARRGLPIQISSPTEMLLTFAVFVVLTLPLYLAARRRALRRTLDD